MPFVIALSLQQAAPSGGGGGGMIALILQFGAIMAIFWFLLIRPQRKQQQKHREMVAALKKGDEIMTEGGVLGEVIHITEDRVTVKTAENTRLVIARPKIQRVFRAQEEAAAKS